MREALARCGAPVVAVSPIIGGRAVKGPTAKMMTELGMIPSAAAVARRYGDLIDGYVMDVEDAGEAAQVAAEGDACADAHDQSRGAGATGPRRARGGGRARLVKARPGLRCVSGIWAVVPVKEFEGAKQRLSPVLSPEERRVLAAIMLEDVLEALSAVRKLAGLIVVTVDPAATALGLRYGARIVTEGARDGHTGAVTAAARLLVREGQAAMMTMPGDIPRATSAEIAATVAAHRAAPSFTIVPAHDDLGSNTIVMSPPDAVPLRFGEDSFYPHLDAARARGIDPLVVRHPGIGMDIDNPVDLVAFLKMSPPAPTRTLAFLEQSGVAARLLDAKPKQITSGQRDLNLTDTICLKILLAERRQTARRPIFEHGTKLGPNRLKSLGGAGKNAGRLVLSRFRPLSPRRQRRACAAGSGRPEREPRRSATPSAVPPGRARRA